MKYTRCIRCTWETYQREKWKNEVSPDDLEALEVEFMSNYRQMIAAMRTDTLGKTSELAVEISLATKEIPA